MWRCGGFDLGVMDRRAGLLAVSRRPELLRPALLSAGASAAADFARRDDDLVGRAVLPTTAHVAVGAAVLATSLALTIRIRALGGLASAAEAARVRSPILADYGAQGNRVNSEAAAIETSAPSHSRVAAYFELTKPRVLLMVLITTLAGFYMGDGAAFDFGVALKALLGTALGRGRHARAQRVRRARVRRQDEPHASSPVALGTPAPHRGVDLRYRDRHRRRHLSVVRGESADRHASPVRSPCCTSARTPR